MMIGESPFSPVQLLWINLIMDTFAAIALATEPPIKSVTVGEPFKPNATLVTPIIKRQVAVATIWNTIIMTIMFLAIILDEEYLAYVPMDSDGEIYERYSKFKRTKITEIFNCFIFLQLFNFINCRKVGVTDFNVL